MALGISMLFQDVELLARAIDDSLSGRRALADAMADCEQQRNAATMADYRLNVH